MKLKRLRWLKSQRGDTIVEVVIAIAVLGVVIGATAVTVNRNTRSLRDTQEHSIALKLAQSQIELFKEYIQTHAPDLKNAGSRIYPGNEFCLKSDAQGTITAEAADSPPCTVNSSGATTPAGDEITYEVSLTTTAKGADGYVVDSDVNWIGLTTENPRVSVAYRLHDIAGAGLSIGQGETCPLGYGGVYPSCIQLPGISLTGQKVNDTTVRFTWTTSGPVEKVECQFNGGGWSTNNCTSGTTRNHPAQGSFNNQTYNFEVRASNRGGIGGSDSYRWRWVSSQEWVPPVTRQVWVPEQGYWYHVCWAYGPNGSCWNEWGGEHGWWVDVWIVTVPAHWETQVVTPGYYRNTSHWEYDV